MRPVCVFFLLSLRKSEIPNLTSPYTHFDNTMTRLKQTPGEIVSPFHYYKPLSPMEGFYCVLIDIHQAEIAKVFNDVEEDYDVMV